MAGSGSISTGEDGGMAGSGSNSAGEDGLMWLHAAATALEVIGVVALWAYQGMFSPCALSKFVNRIRERLRLPVGNGWREVCIVGACGTVSLAGFGLATGFMRPGLPESLPGAVSTFFMLFIAPGLFEEVLFRCLLLPTKGEEKENGPQPVNTDESREEEPRPPSGCGDRTKKQKIQQAAALAIFMVYHLDFVHTPPLFHDPRFLVMALILGVACQEALVRSDSVWPGAFMHWFWVWGWLTFGSPPKM